MIKPNDPISNKSGSDPNGSSRGSKPTSGARQVIDSELDAFLTNFAFELASISDLNRFRSFVIQHATALVNADEGEMYLETRPLSLDDTPLQLTVPLRRRDEMLGVLRIRRYPAEVEGKPRAVAPEFSKEEKHRLTLLGNIATAGLAGIVREQEIQKRAGWRDRALDLLQETVQAMGSTLESGPLMRRIVKAAVHALQADTGVLAMLNSNDQLVVRAAAGPLPGDLIDKPMKIEQSLIGWVVRHQRAARVADPSADPRVSAEHSAALKSPTMHGLLAAPLVTKGQTIGAIEVANKQIGTFNEGDLHLLEVFAQSAAAAIENVLLYERLQRQSLQQDNIIHISQATSSADDVQAVLQKVVESALAVVPTAFTAVVHLLDQEKGMLKIACYAGRPLWDTREQPFSVGEGIAGHVFATGQSVNVPDVLKAPLYIPGPGPIIYRSLLVAPIIAKDQPLGTLSINGLEPNAFGPDDEQMMSALAVQTAVALHNAQLVDSLRDSESRYRGLVENVDALLLTADSSGNIIFASGRWFETLGYQPDEVIGFSFRNFCHPDDWPVLAKQGRRLLSKPTRKPNLRYRALHKDGSIRWHLANAVSIADQAGQVDHLYGVIHDVTAQMQAEQIIARHADQLAALSAIASRISRSPDIDEIVHEGLQKLLNALELDAAGLALLDAEQGRFIPHTVIGLPDEFLDLVVPWQIAAPVQIGYTQQPVVIPDVLDAPQLADWPGLQEMIRSEQVRTLATVPVIAQDEMTGIMVVVARAPDAIPPEAADLLMAVGQQFGIAINNATLYAQSEERATDLETAYRQLQDLARRKSQFVQNASHELRTPLTLLLGYLERLLNDGFGPLSDEQKDVIKTLNRRSQQLANLVDDITSLIEIESDLQDIDTVDLGDIVTFCVAIQHERAHKADIVIETEWPDAAVIVMGNRYQLMKAFNHLLDNAIKFSPSGGCIRVKGQVEQNKAFVQVTDQGIGISADEQEYIFDRFYQVDGSITRRYGGTGVGLAIVKETIEAHKGTVEVKSNGEEGEGTTFTIELPLLETYNT